MHIANAQSTVKMKITIGSASFIVTTYDNATARALVRRSIKIALGMFGITSRYVEFKS